MPLNYGYLPILKFSSWQQGWILSLFGIAAILAMFFSTQFADRNFAAERFMAFSHLVGGAAILGLTWVESFWPFFGLMAVHCLFYVPTLSISNSIAFAHLQDAQSEFGKVRLWGTIGWIAASLPFVFILTDWQQVASLQTTGVSEWINAVFSSSLQGEAAIKGMRYSFTVAGIASLLLAGYCLFLPHTPPRTAKHNDDKLAWLEAVRLLKIGFLFALFAVTLLDSIVHKSYFVFAARYFTSIGVQPNWVMPVMSIGQLSEIAAMWLLGLTLKRLGWRYTLLIGILAHALRFGLFAFYPYPSVAIAANLLHGVCFAFYIATVYIFVDEFFPKDARASAQGLFNLLILGVGPLIANFAGPYLVERYTNAQSGLVDYRSLFQIPIWLAIAAAVLLLVSFFPPAKQKSV